MGRNRESINAKPMSLADPALRVCTLAMLRALSKAQVGGPELPRAVQRLLGSLAEAGDLLSSATTAKQRKVVEEALLTSEDDDTTRCEEDLEDDRFDRLLTGTCSVPTHRLAEPTRSVLEFIKLASSQFVRQLSAKLLTKWERVPLSNGVDWLEGNVLILQRLFLFTDTEAQVARLALAFSCLRGQYDIIDDSISELFFSHSQRKQSVMKLACAIGSSPQSLSDAYSATGQLRASGVMANVTLHSYDLDDVLALSELGQLFASEPFENEEAVRQRILKPLALSADASLVFSHLELQHRDITALLAGAMNTGTAGVNVLFYGPPGTGKTEFAKKLAGDLGVTCYQVGFASSTTGMDASRDDRLSFLRLANRLILPEERALILLDEAEDIFDSIAPDPWRGRAARRGSKAWLNALLESMRIPTLWITNDVEIDGAHLRRFTYVLELNIPPVNVRRQIARAQTSGLALSEQTIALLARNDAVTPAMLGAAAKFARLAKPSDADVDAALMRHIEASQHALGLVPSCSIVDGETRFDPRFVNLESSIGVDALIRALRRTGRAGLLFSGPPGTGKTQLVSHLARQLDREVVYRTGSDLLDKYVGGTEQRIARLFRSCDVEREILFLDEAEGLLGSREGARVSWEVTQVNEFLRSIEQFRGIFIAATNHVSNLDAALMRRFAFRLEFKPLTLQQRLEMFTEVSGLELTPGSSGARQLADLDALTAGDVANAKRRLSLLDGTPSIQDWIDQLYSEAAAKPNFHKRKIGFT